MSDSQASPRRSNARHHQKTHIARLQYPTLPPLTASVEEWLSRSRPADNMTSDNITDSQPKSLSDSWAELSVSDFHSEDGSRSEPTDAGSIIDQATPDDVASLDGRSTSSEVDRVEVEENQGQHDEQDDQSEEEQDDEQDYEQDDQDNKSITESRHFPMHFHTTPPRSGIDDSNLTTRTAFRQSIDPIEFVEPDKWPEMERVELKHTIRIFEDAELAEMKVPESFDSATSTLMATVQQTMAKTGMELDKPFRVLYIGRPEFRNIILDKIGDVLVSNSSAGSPTSSAESSRYHVVPTSFGAGAVPNFAELLPIHVQLVVDECVEASAKSTDEHSPLSLIFKNRPSCRSWWDGEDYRVSSVTDWTLPDMAIIFVSSNDDSTAIQTQNLAHKFLDRHGIPAMVIAEEPLWSKPRNIPLNHNSLHMCLESRHHQTGETLVLQSYPIDLKTFESIAPDQLNRNLASLMGLYPKKTVKVSISTDSPNPLDSWTFASLEKYSRSWIPLCLSNTPLRGNLLTLLTLTLLSTIILSVGYTAFSYLAVFISQCFAGSAISHSISSTPAPTLSAVLNGDYKRQSSLILRPAGHLRDLKDLSPDCPIDGFAGIDLELAKTPDTFEIKTLGDCHVIIRTPRKLTSSRKQPPFNVSVCRGEKMLEYRLSWLLDGVFTLVLAREDAWGLVNLTITAKSKPMNPQTTVLDFGIPWLKAANWRRAALLISSQITHDIQDAQTGLTEVYGRLSTDLQLIMGDVVKAYHDLRSRQETQEPSILAQPKQLSEAITRNAIQSVRSAVFFLHKRSTKVNQEAKELMSYTWQSWRQLSRSVSTVDLHSAMDRVHEVKRATLSRAQTRARYIVGRG